MTIARRRLLTIAAAAAALPLTGRAGREATCRWTGTALGAEAEIRIAGLDRNAAARAVAAVVAEVERLEQVFSLYRPDSELSRLNRDGALLGPSQDFRLLLEQGLAYWSATGGAFNPAIQPVWRFLARHFAAASEAPGAGALEAALRLCDPAGIDVAARRIGLRPGMALTFNGIAQGYITDRAADLLRSHGLAGILLNLGEIRALPGRPWPVAVADSDLVLALDDGAVASSAGRGTPFTRDLRWHHLIDPRTGESARFVDGITVTAPTATLADALSTALFVLPDGERRAIAARFPASRLVLPGQPGHT